MTVLKQGLTLEEFLKLPERKPALEYFKGKVSQKVSPKGQHSIAQLRMASYINAMTEPDEIALALPELRATYSGASPVPDIAVYRWDRIPLLPDGKIADDFWEPPDIAIEIASPGQTLVALTRRCRWYVDNGVGAAVLIRPSRETVTLFLPDQDPVTLSGQETLDLTGVIVGLRLNVARIFQALYLRSTRR